MNIVHVVVGLAMGGAEKVIQDLTYLGTKDKVNNHKVICLTGTIDRLKDFLELGIEVEVWNMQKSVTSIFGHVKKLNTYLKTNEINLVHAHMTHAMQLLTFYNIFYKSIPIVFTPHSINLESKFRGWFFHFFKKFRDVDILLSEDQKKYYNTRTIVIPNGIDLERFVRRSPLALKDDECFKIVHIGRFNKAKNHIGLIDAFEKFSSTVTNSKLYLVGHGELYKKIEESIEQKSLQGKVILLGLQSNIADILQDKHLFILPSLWEGLPISLLEAGAMKIPILASEVGAIESLLSNSRGTLCKSDNLEQQLIYCYENYSICLAKADNMYQYLVDKFSLATAYRRHIQLYTGIIKD